MDFGASSTVFAPVRVGLEVVLAPTATPTPTCQPRIHALSNRQESVSLATCGFIGGNADLPVTCGSALYCATTSTYVGCCESTNCVGIFTTCYDFLGNSCDVTCQNNPENLVCPTALPYCAEYQYEGGSIGYGCAQDRGYTTSVLLTTKQALGSVETPTPTPTPTPSPTPSPTPEPAPSSSSLGAGAIAGIAIGGVAVLALIIFLIWFVRRRKQKDATRTTPYTNVAREEPSPPMQDRHTVTSTFSDSTTAYALPSPRTDPWKQSWQSYSDQDAGYSARFSTTNGSEVPRSTTGVPGSPAELPASDSRTLPSELDGSQR